MPLDVYFRTFAMTVSAIVPSLAEAIIAAKTDLSPRQRLLLELLRILPLYKAAGNVAIWDQAYHAAMPHEDDTSENGRLIQATYEFATVPFYGSFQADVTLQEYEYLRRCFRTSDIHCQAVDRFTDL